MKTFFTLAVAFLLLPFLSIGQDDARINEILRNGSEADLVTESSILIQEGNLYQAGLMVDKLLEMKPNSPNYNYRKGYILLEMSFDFEAAQPLLEKACTQTSKKYDPFSKNETSSPIDSYFLLGKCYHMAMNIDKAEEYFQKFLDNTISKSPNIYFAKMYLEQCKVAKAEMAKPKNVQLSNVGVVNTKNPEYSPVISLDGTALYFTSRRKWPNGGSDLGLDKRYNLYPEDIYASFQDFDSTWLEPIRLEFCDSLQNEATLAVSPDERRIYVYQDTKGNGDIFYSDFSTNRFQGVTHLDNNKINTDSWETHCTVSPDGETMYFVSDRKGGFGSRDIYYCKKQADGTWGDPKNVGANINSALDEESPFVSIDNSTLYFSSNGNRSMGGFDIFMSKWENGAWGPAINLGYPINSSCDDLFYTTTSDGLTGYITSVRADGKGDKDIYQVKNNYLGVKNIAVLNGRVNVIGGKQIPEDVYVSLKCIDCEKPYEKKIFPRIRDGVFTNALEPCKEYEVSFSYKDNAKKNFYSEKFKTDCTKEYSEVYREFWLDINKGMMVKPYFIVGTITDNKTNAKLEGVNVVIKNNNNGDQLFSLNTRKNGTYKSDTLGGMKQGDEGNFHVTLIKDGYLTMSYDYKVKLGDESKIVIDGVMERVELGLDLAKYIKPIYFDFNKSNIRKDAAKELDVIVRIMKENLSIKIELGSHTDTRGSDASNLSLSDRRAKSSAEYIISKGIDRSRISGKGYGETKLKVTDAEIEAMPTEDAKEAAHQLNRRTEFIIVE